MKKTRGIFSKNGPLRWLMQATLVLGLLAFSGNASSLKSYSPEPTKTELAETNRVSTKRAASFIKINVGRESLLTPYCNPASFTSYLIQYSADIRVKLKTQVNEISIAQLQEKHFLKGYHFHNSKGSETDKQRG